MRSRPEIDVSAIAKALGGGGHRQAAGCTLPGPFSPARDILIETFDRLAATSGQSVGAPVARPREAGSARVLSPQSADEGLMTED
jgi:phosphoesterase RecJ-like protein